MNSKTTEESVNDLKLALIKLGVEIKKAFLSDVRKIVKKIRSLYEQTN